MYKRQDVKGVVINVTLTAVYIVFESVVLRVVAGNAFHATGPETENARSPSLVRVLVF